MAKLVNLSGLQRQSSDLPLHRSDVNKRKGLWEPKIYISDLSFFLTYIKDISMNYFLVDGLTDKKLKPHDFESNRDL